MKRNKVVRGVLVSVTALVIITGTNTVKIDRLNTPENHHTYSKVLIKEKKFKKD